MPADDARPGTGTGTATPTLSVVIPAFNEEARIGGTLAAVDGWLSTRGIDGEILVVDDGSTDRTADRVGATSATAVVRCLRGDRNRGKGHAVRRGVLAARGAFVVFTDADLSTPIDELDGFLRVLQEGHPLVIGSRRLAAARIVKRQPLHRQWMGRVFSWLARRLLHPEVTDFTCGFKAFRREIVPVLFTPLTLDGWAFDAELLHVAWRRGVPVRELPVRWADRLDTRVRLWRDVGASAAGLGLVVWRGRCGVYDRQAAGGPPGEPPPG